MKKMHFLILSAFILLFAGLRPFLGFFDDAEQGSSLQFSTPGMVTTPPAQPADGPEAENVSATARVFAAQSDAGEIGLTAGRKSDHPYDNVFSIAVPEDLSKNWEVWLEYELYGIHHFSGVSRSINDELSAGGAFVRLNEKWTTQREKISQRQLKTGTNIVRFTVPEQARYGYKVKDVRIRLLPATKAPEAVVLAASHQLPQFDGIGYVRGYVNDPQVKVYVDGLPVETRNGVFEGVTRQHGSSSFKAAVQLQWADKKVEYHQLSFEGAGPADVKNAFVRFADHAAVQATAQADWKLEMAGIVVSGAACVLQEEKEITVTALQAVDMPPMGPGMINVTAHASGYRLLPHNSKFAGALSIKIAVDTTKLPAGHSISNVRTFYFDEGTNKWTMVPKDTLPVTGLWASALTDHFTDFVNAIIKSPELPTSQAYTPTMLKDLKAANPLEGVNMISPPQANNNGTASISLPIEIPAGRQGMQPQLALQYSSEGGNGWLGLGWSLSIPAINVDTRWGVPRYYSDLETEGYLMNGEELRWIDGSDSIHPLVHRTSFVARNSTPGSSRRFIPRVEGSFNRIVRKGITPATYWWEVTDKNGVTHYYGKYSADTAVNDSCILKKDGKIGYWALAESRDLFGNFVKYSYKVDVNSGRFSDTNQGRQLYLTRITYTGHGTTPGKYAVEFASETTVRPDTIISARYGFKEVTARRLSRIRVKYDTTLVRSYFLRYKESQFNKSLICYVMESFGKDSIPQNNDDAKICDVETIVTPIDLPPGYKVHRFEYHNSGTLFGNAVTVTGSPLDLYIAPSDFGSIKSQIQSDDLINFPGLVTGNHDLSLLGTSQGMSLGGGANFYFGIGKKTSSKMNSISGSYNYSWGRSRTASTFMDIDGDGFPDRVFMYEGDVFYQKVYMSGGVPVVHYYPVPVASLGQLGRQTSHTHGGGLQLAVGLTESASANASVGYSRTKTTIPFYFSDVDADGLPDFISNGTVLFNRPDGNGEAAFQNFTTDTVQMGGTCEYILHTGTINDSISITVEPENPNPFDGYMMGHQAVRLWKAPFTGLIDVYAPIQLIEDTSYARSQALHTDGVRYTIQHNSSELVMDTLPAGDYNVYQGDPFQLQVNRGDQLYFRLLPRENRTWDDVSWDPEIQYVALGPEEELAEIDNSPLDADRKYIYRFKASDDFLLMAPQVLSMPYTGNIRIYGNISAPAMSDSLRFTISGATGNVIYQRAYAGGSGISFNVDTTLSVSEDDTLNFNALVNSLVPYEALGLRLTVDYTSIIDTSGTTAIDTADEAERVRFHPVVKISVVENIIRTTGVYSLPGGSTTATARLQFSGSPSGTLVFTVKKDRHLVAKKVITVTSGAITGDSVLSFSNATDTHFFDFHTTSPALAAALTGAQVKITQGGTTVISAGFFGQWPDTLQKFGNLYRGWGQFAYNGSQTAPINQSLLMVNRHYTDTNNIKFMDAGDITTMAGSMSSMSLDDLINGFGNNLDDLLDAPFHTMLPDYEAGAWKGPGNLTTVGHDYQSNSLPLLYGASEHYDSPVPITSSSRDKKAVRKETLQKGWSFGAGIGPSSVNVGGSHFRGKDEMLADFMDLNGDHYPDAVGQMYAQYTFPQGGFSPHVVRHDILLSGVEQTISGNNSVTTGATIGGTPIRFEKNASSEVKGCEGTVKSNAPKGSISGNTAGGENTTAFTMLDINGDGLPDKVNGSGQVAINLGYAFEPFVNWGFEDISIGGSTNYGVSLGVSVPIKEKGENSWSVGLSAGYSDNNNFRMPLDINGDGLTDFIAATSGSYTIHLNTGNGFVAIGGQSLDIRGASINYNIGGNGAATFGMFIPVPLASIKIGGGGSFDLSFTRAFEKTQFLDMNNDGHVDFVYEDGGTTKVRFSQLGKQDLMTRVQTSVGSSYTLDYTLKPSTQQMPQSKWVMSSLKVFDGFTGDGSDTMYYSYAYDYPVYSRFERVFFGYDTVVTSQHRANGNVYRSTLQRYHTHDFLFKGLKYFELVRDSAGNKYVENITSYRKKEISTGNVVEDANAWCFGPYYPALYREDSYFYEGLGTAQVHTQKEYEHGPYGNVKKYTNRGDTTDSNDDFFANISYTTNTTLNLLAMADTIKVFKGATLMRERLAVYNTTTGRMTKLRANTGSAYAETDFGYDSYGNIIRQILPENHQTHRMRYLYTYDPAVHTYVTEVEDSVFSLVSETAYDYRLGKPTQVTDVAGNVTQYTYSAYGRLKTIRGPKEIAASKPYTLKFDYWDEYTYVYPWGVSSYPKAELWARTSHYDAFNTGNNITTVLFADGAGKAIQTKKKATIAGVDSLVVSGRVFYDDFGRAVSSYYPVTQSLVWDSIFNSASIDPVNPTQTTYDLLDRPVRQVYPDLTRDSTVYGFGNDSAYGIKRFKTSVTDAKNITTHVFKDPKGQNTTVSAPHGAVTSFKYNPLGELTESKDPELNVTSYTYDLLGRKVSRNHPDAGVTNYAFDKAGNLTAMAPQNLISASQEITYTYYYNRLELIEYPQNPEANVYYAYGNSGNEAGRIVKSQDAAGIHAYTYGNMGELIEKISTSYVPVPGGTHYTFKTSWEYDSWNRVKSITYPDNELVEYDYDNGGQLIWLGGTKFGQGYDYVNSVLYDKFGSRTKLTYGNGIETDYTYHSQTRRLTNLYTTDGTDDLQDFDYTYDVVGNIISIDNSATGLSGLGGTFEYDYGYDSLYRLVSGTGTSMDFPYTLAMQYTPSGNILKKTLSTTKNILGSTLVVQYENDYDYSAGPHKVYSVTDALSVIPTIIHDWDPNGNMMFRQFNTGAGILDQFLCWDEENRLAVTKDDNYLTHYLYDAGGTRAWKIAAAVDYMWVSGTGWVAFGDLNLRTLYQSEFMTMTDQGYTKHFFIEGQRVASKIGNGFAAVESPDIVAGQEPLHKDLESLPERMWEKVIGDLSCVGVNAENFTYHVDLTAMNDLLTGGEEAEGEVYYYHGDHLSSSSFITDGSAYATQHLQYLPFGEDFIHQQNSSSYYTPYTFSAKERDMETEFSYFGARYYDAGLSIWLSVDPMSDKYPSLSAYNYCAWNPVMLVDPDGMQISNHTDEGGNVIAVYDDGDDGVYVHKTGTTKADIDQQRSDNSNTGGTGTHIGEIGGHIDVSSIMANKLNSSSEEAKGMGITDYFFAVKPKGIWDLKANSNTIFGLAWKSDQTSGTRTTFSFSKYSGMNAADVGNYHAGYTGRYTYGGNGMSSQLLWRGAGAAETTKSIFEGRLLDAGRQMMQLMGSPIIPTGMPPYGDRPRDFMWNTIGMTDADKNKRR